MPKIVDHIARRQELGEVAARLIARGGLEAATVREIADKSAYSKGVVEHYFDNKEELIAAALNCANDSYQARVDKGTRGLQGLAALQFRMHTTLPLTSKIQDEWKIRLVFWSMAAINPDLRKQQKARFDRAVEHFAADIRYARKQGEISGDSEPEQQANQILHSLSGLSCAALHNPTHYSRKVLLEEAELIVHRVRRGY